MPIHVRDPWRFQYFENVPCPDDVHIPIDDIDCWDWFPDQRAIYDKLNVAQSQGIACGTKADWPKSFPVFVKPRINLKGMGLGSGILNSAVEFATYMHDDLIWTELFSGPHVSTDCAVIDGEVHWIRHATGTPWTDGMFKHWVIHSNTLPNLEGALRPWIKRMLLNYTGMLNIETIGGKIIEAHLRFADQWCDLYGAGWMGSVVELYHHKRWTFDDRNRRDGYSVPLFAAHGKMPELPSQELQDDMRGRDGVSSLQITFHRAKSGDDHPMPPGGFRLAIVNCTDFEAGMKARQDLAKVFQGVEVILP
jgi:hypothetical protein